MRRLTQREGGFSLVEIVVTIGIIATVVIALLGILPVGMESAEEAANQTVLAVVLEDVHNRLEGVVLEDGVVENSPYFYDLQGVFVPDGADAETLATRIYRADVELIAIDSAHRPEDTSGLMAAQVRVWWPVDAASGAPLREGGPETSITFYVTPLTGADWARIDPSYEPKIEF